MIIADICVKYNRNSEKSPFYGKIADCNHRLRIFKVYFLDFHAVLLYTCNTKLPGGVGMTIGQKIFKLRTDLKLSQEELAERLGVSRQSVSKWETDASVPELDKLIKLSGTFGVSLDALVRDEPSEVQAEAECAKDTGKDTNIKENNFPPRKIVGTILACTGAVIFMLFLFLSGTAGGILFAPPFFLCAVVCFIAKHRIALWCSWSVYFCADAYTRYGTAVNRHQVFYTHIWTPSMNYMILALSWMMMLGLCALVVWTLVSFRKYICKPCAASFAVIFGCVALEVVLHFLSGLIGENILKLYMSELSNSYIRSSVRLFGAAQFLLEWLAIAVIVVVLVKVVGVIRFIIKNGKHRE